MEEEIMGNMTNLNNLSKLVRNSLLGNVKLLDRRTALITGGGSGIGYAIARAYLLSGAEIIITGRSQKKLDIAKEKLMEETGCKEKSVLAYVMDIRNAEQIDEEIESIWKKKNGFIDILVNNAGVLKGSAIGKTEVNHYDYIMDTNLRGTYFVSQSFANRLCENGIKGNILMIASSASLTPAISPYRISKWGIRALTAGLAKQLIPHGIVVNGIAPGPTATPMLGKKEDDVQMELSTSPSGRYVTCDEVAYFSTILVSDIARMVVGDLLYLTGGAGIVTFDDN